METSVQSRVPARICGRSTHSHVSRDRPGERPPQAARRMWLCKGQLGSLQWGGFRGLGLERLGIQSASAPAGFCTLYSKGSRHPGPYDPPRLCVFFPLHRRILRTVYAGSQRRRSRETWKPAYKVGSPQEDADARRIPTFLEKDAVKGRRKQRAGCGYARGS